MKKFWLFLLLMVFLFVLSCTIPREIEVRATTPLIKLSADLNVNEMLLEMIGDALGDDSELNISILDYTANQTVQSYILHLTALEDVFHLVDMLESDIFGFFTSNGIMGFDDLTEIPIPDDQMPPITLPLSSIGDFLGDLEFNPEGIKAKLYIRYGAEVLENFCIGLDFYIANDEGKISDINEPLVSLLIPELENQFVQLGNRACEIDTDRTSYDDNDLPVWGTEIKNFDKLLNAKQDILVKVKLYFQQGSLFLRQKLREPLDITVEVAIILPLKLDAVAGCEFPLPLPEDTFDGIGDSLGAVTDVLQSLSLFIDMSPYNPFSGTELIIKQEDPPLNLIFPFNSNPMNISIDASHLNQLKGAGADFKPSISLGFPQDITIGIPRDFTIKTLSLKANINYSMELGGN